jgi:hypothetical protein
MSSARLDTEITSLHGRDRLTGVDLSRRSDSTAQRRPCVGLFCFIGATPATGWLEGVALDDDGFVLTDTGLSDENSHRCGPRSHVAHSPSKRASHACSQSGMFDTARRNGWPRPSARDQAQSRPFTARSLS